MRKQAQAVQAGKNSTTGGALARSWYRFGALSGDQPTKAELYVYDYLGLDPWTGEGIGAKQFIDELNALPESVTDIVVRVNSGGGSVFDAVPIANALREHRAKIDMRIEGIAASAATIVTMAGDTITIADNALVMIHNAIGFAWGSAKDMRAEAEALDRVQSAIVATYQWHSKLSADDLVALMDAVTWMDGEEAVANGFATEIGQAMKAAARIDQRILAKAGAVPEKYQARLDEMRAEAEEEQAAGDPPAADPVDPPTPAAADPAPAPENRGSNVVDITATRERQIRDEEVTRCEAIGRAFSAIARIHPGIASGIEDLRQRAVTNRLSVEAASRSLTDFLAARSGEEIVNVVQPLLSERAEAKVDTKGIYEQLNARKAERGRK